MTAASSRIVLGGRVEHVTKSGALLVVARAGSLQRNVVCPAVEGVDVGSEVAVEVGPDLEFGIILPPRSRT